MDDISAAYHKLCMWWNDLSASDRAAMLDIFALSFAYNSGKIENDAITYHDTSEIFDKGRVVSFTGDLRTLFEINNLKNSWGWAMRWLKKHKALDEDSLLHAHRLLTQGTYDQARWDRGERPGSWKLGEYVVGVYNVGCPAKDAPGAVRELLDEVNTHMDVADKALTISCYFHARLVEIHPFADGNGRVGRLCANMLLLMLGTPPVIFREQDRMAYFGALDAFHADGSLRELIEFCKVETILTWSELCERGI